MARMRFLVGPSATVLAIVCIAVANDHLFSIPNPAVIYLLAVVFAAFHGGMTAGLVSAAIAVGYAALFFSKPGMPFHYTPDNLAGVVILLVTTPATALLVGVLHRRAVAGARRMRDLASHAIASDRRLRAMLRSVPGMVYERRLSPQGEMSFTFVSEGVERVFGISAAEAVAGPNGFYDKTAPEERDAVIESIRRSAATMQPWKQQFRVIRQDGQEHWVQAMGTPRRAEDGGTIWDGVAIDITEHKLLESELQRAKQTAEDASRQLAEAAVTDALTGLSNRRLLAEKLQIELASTRRTGQPMALLMLDVDYFKRFNDTYGHLAGDDCLRRLAALLKARVRRPRDVAARFGGEEFILLLPETDNEGAAEVARDLLKKMAELDIAHAGSPLGRVSVSIGAIAVRDRADTNERTVLERVDRALYAAKNGGRNRFVFADT